MLRLGLLAAITMSDSIPHFYLLQEKSFKKDIWGHHGNHGLLMTGILKTSAIERILVVLDAYKIHILKSYEYFGLIVNTVCSKVVTPHLSDFFLDPLKFWMKPFPWMEYLEYWLLLIRVECAMMLSTIMVACIFYSVRGNSFCISRCACLSHKSSSESFTSAA